MAESPLKRLAKGGDSSSSAPTGESRSTNREPGWGVLRPENTGRPAATGSTPQPPADYVRQLINPRAPRTTVAPATENPRYESLHELLGDSQNARARIRQPYKYYPSPFAQTSEERKVAELEARGIRSSNVPQSHGGRPGRVTPAPDSRAARQNEAFARAYGTDEESVREAKLATLRENQENRQQDTYTSGLVYDFQGRSIKAMNDVTLKPLTRKEFKALPKQDRLLVSHNTAQKRFSDADEGLTRPAEGSAQLTAYNEALGRVFADPSRSQQFAPNTVAYLDAMGVRGQRGRVEDFTSMRAAVLDSDREQMRGERIESSITSRPQLVDTIREGARGVRQMLRGAPLSSAQGSTPENLDELKTYSDRIAAFIAPATQAMGVPIKREADESSQTFDALLLPRKAPDTLALIPQDQQPAIQDLFHFVSDSNNRGKWTVQDLISSLTQYNIDPQMFYNYVGASLQDREIGHEGIYADSINPLDSKEILTSMGLDAKWIDEIRNNRTSRKEKKDGNK